MILLGTSDKGMFEPKSSFVTSLSSELDSKSTGSSPRHQPLNRMTINGFMQNLLGKDLVQIAVDSQYKPNSSYLDKFGKGYVFFNFWHVCNHRVTIADLVLFFRKSSYDYSTG